MNQNKTNILYLSRTGLLEPLGQSQVMNYLKGLSKNYSIFLITYEKKKDIENNFAMSRAYSDCSSNNICWLPQQFHPELKFISLSLNILKMIWIVRKLIVKENIELIHARSYIPAFVALVMYKLKRIPFIFDMRALWIEELINSGKVKRYSILHNVILKIEKKCLLKSKAVITLTNSAVNYLRTIYPNETKNQLIRVIPTCANLKNFKPSITYKRSHMTHGCIGTILSSWFLIDWLAKWIQICSSNDSKAYFQIVTRDNAKNIRMLIDPKNKIAGKLKIYSKLSKQMPDELKSHSSSVMFFTSGVCKLGSSPTRLAEALGSGLPVVVNEGVGDVADIVTKNNVGIVVKNASKDQMEKAYKELLILMQDSELSNRCRKTAEKLFSLEKGIESYKEVYEIILNKNEQSCVA